MDKIIIYCDGGARNNGKENNVGGYGIVLMYKGHKKEIHEGFRDVTNNQMELMAVIKALESLKTFHIPIEIYTDSAYVCNGLNQKWYVKWKSNGWKTSQKTPVENKELWERLVDLYEKGNITVSKVKGHSDNEYNNRADELANIGMDEIERGR